MYLCESEREKIYHDDKGNTLSVRKGKSGSTIIFMAFEADYWDCLKKNPNASKPPEHPTDREKKIYDVDRRFHSRFIYVGVDISFFVLLTGGRS